MGGLGGVTKRCESHFREWETKKWTSDLRPAHTHYPPPPPAIHLGALFPPDSSSLSLSHLTSLKRLPFQFRILDSLPSLWKLQATWGTLQASHPGKAFCFVSQVSATSRALGLWGSSRLSGSRVLGKLTREASTHGVRRVAVGEVRGPVVIRTKGGELPGQAQGQAEDKLPGP